jgi:hypothetical protein
MLQYFSNGSQSATYMLYNTTYQITPAYEDIFCVLCSSFFFLWFIISDETNSIVWTVNALFTKSMLNDFPTTYFIPPPQKAPERLVQNILFTQASSPIKIFPLHHANNHEFILQFFFFSSFFLIIFKAIFERTLYS